MARENLLIVGGTGSSKTTLVNASLAEPAFDRDRVALIEDKAELQCSSADQIQILTKRTEPAVTTTDLMRHTPRLRPDRNAPETESGRRACSDPPRAAAPTAPPLTGTLRRRRPLDGASRLAV